MAIVYRVTPEWKMMTRNTNKKTLIRDYMAETGLSYMEASRQLDRLDGIVHTPWSLLDNLLGGGLNPGSLYTIAGRPGDGTTQMGIFFAAALNERRAHTLVYSLEQSDKEYTDRLYSILKDQASRGELGEENSNLVHYASKHVTLNSSPMVTMSQLEDEVRNLQKTRPITAIVIDDFELLVTSKTNQGYEDAVRRLHNLARELMVPIVILARLLRNAEDDRANLKKILFSSSLEQSSDAVLLLQFDRQRQAFDVEVRKNRRGPQGKFSVNMFTGKLVDEMGVDLPEV